MCGATRAVLCTIYYVNKACNDFNSVHQGLSKTHPN